jgi:hypothetical protein
MPGGLPRYAPLLLLALAWEAVSRLGIVSPAALPPLDMVATAWLNLAESGDLWSNGVASISRGAAGLGLAIACGSVIGVLMASYLPQVRRRDHPAEAEVIGFGGSGRNYAQQRQHQGRRDPDETHALLPAVDLVHPDLEEKASHRSLEKETQPNKL